MNKKPYSELLLDPRWQRKRLEILQRSDFSCESCESADKTLHVHHRLYKKGAMPWEYDDAELQCLCKDCHEKNHKLKAQLTTIIGEFSIEDIQQVLGYAKGMRLFCDGDEAECFEITSYYDAQGVSDVLSARLGGAEEIMSAVDDTRMVTHDLIQAVYSKRKSK